MIRKAFVVAPIVALSLVAGLSAPSPAAAQAKKQPPACGAVNFRPFEGTLTDKPEQVGHYRSRFGTIDLLASQQNGKPKYTVQANNKPLQPLSGNIPNSAFPCLNSKHVATPPQPVGGTCDGSRFRVAIDNSTKQKLVMLFALNGNDWKLCEAGTPQGK